MYSLLTLWNISSEELYEALKHGVLDQHVDMFRIFSYASSY